jgi:hypothetical protein
VSFLSLIVSPLANVVTTHLKNKAEEKQAVHKRKLTQIKNEASWDETQAKNANTSLKDEWFVFLLSIPMIGAFVPDMVPYVKEGFVVLNEMPEFYKAFLGAAIAASFGIKSLANWKK